MKNNSAENILLLTDVVGDDDNLLVMDDPFEPEQTMLPLNTEVLNQLITAPDAPQAQEKDSRSSSDDAVGLDITNIEDLFAGLEDLDFSSESAEAENISVAPQDAEEETLQHRETTCESTISFPCRKLTRRIFC